MGEGLGAEGIRVRVAGVAIRDDRVLLVRHRKGGDSYWLLPGGGVEPGERLHAALQREFLEELRLAIRVGPLFGIADSIAPDSSRHVLQIAFRVEARGEPAFGDDPRVVEARFVNLSEVQDLRMLPDIRSAIVDGATAMVPDSAYRPADWAV